jgi:hypothetical protein
LRNRSEKKRRNRRPYRLAMSETKVWRLFASTNPSLICPLMEVERPARQKGYGQSGIFLKFNTNQ